MERSSPSTLYHFLVEIRRWVEGMSARISAKRLWRRGGREMVRAAVSMIHPRTNLRVDHVQSPSRSFFKDTGSRRLGGSCGCNGRKTVSMA